MPRPAKSNPALPSSSAPVRLAKFLAEAGVAARRTAERFIAEGHVSVNGQRVTTLPTFVDPVRDTITVDGKPVQPVSETVIYALYKPRGFVSTMHDEQGRPHLAQLVPASPRVFPVGRLDRESEGLILLTNDGELALRLTHPRYEHTKHYRIWTTASRRSVPELLKVLGRPHRIAGRPRQFDRITFIGRDRGQLIFEGSVHEGLKHLVRRLMDAAGLTVLQLVRTQHGPVQLGDLTPGQWRRVDRRVL